MPGELIRTVTQESHGEPAMDLMTPQKSKNETYWPDSPEPLFPHLLQLKANKSLRSLTGTTERRTD